MTHLLRSLAISGDEVEGYADLAAMRDASDGLVLVEIVGRAGVREISGGPPEDVVGYLQVQATVLDASSGPWAAKDQLTIEFLAPSNPEAVEALLADARSVPPGQQAVVFLRAKRGKGEEGLFRPVNSLGLWTDDGDMVTPPLYIEEVDSASRYLSALGDPRDLRALFATLSER